MNLYKCGWTKDLDLDRPFQVSDFKLSILAENQREAAFSVVKNDYVPDGDFKEHDSGRVSVWVMVASGEPANAHSNGMPRRVYLAHVYLTASTYLCDLDDSGLRVQPYRNGDLPT